MRALWLVLLILLLVALLPFAGRRTAGTERPMNLVFLMDDQHNPRMLGCDSNGFGGLVRSLTPQLDRLADTGMRFPHAYCVSPQCVPSRLSLLTGRVPEHHGVHWNQVWEPARGELTLPALARRHGLVTASFGKHHLRWLDHPGAVTDHGFDQVVDSDDHKRACEELGVSLWREARFAEWMQQLPAGFTTQENALHPAGWYTDQALAFLEARAGEAGDGQPFALWLSFEGPHAPILPSAAAQPLDWAHLYHPFEELALPPNHQAAVGSRMESFRERYANVGEAEHKEALSYYYGLVSQLDFNIGRVLERLEQLGIEGQTLVVFTSDHGEYASEFGAWTKGGSVHECLTRVPLLIRAPGTEQPGSVAQVVTSGVDLFPTLVELLGWTPTQLERLRLDGRSLAQLLLSGRAPSDWREAAFVSFGLERSKRVEMAVTTTDKWSVDRRNGEQSYFDLRRDPWERENRIDDPDARSRVAWLRSLHAQRPLREAAPSAPYAPALDSGAPAPSANPDPAQGVTDVDPAVDLGWLPATAARRQIVRLGTDPRNLERRAELEPMAQGFNLGTLELATTYYWSVEAHNAHGASPGPVWSFRTADEGPRGPGLAHTPAPADHEGDVSRGVELRWSAAPDAEAYDVWFGAADGELAPVARGLTSCAHPAPELAAGRAYAWRVDSLDARGGTQGTRWTFEVSAAGLPQPAARPSPAHLSTGIRTRRSTRLAWAPADEGLQHDIYLGTSFPLEYRGRVAETFFRASDLEPGRVYYWRVDRVAPAGARTGFTWRFETAPGP